VAAAPAIFVVLPAVVCDALCAQVLPQILSFSGHHDPLPPRWQPLAQTGLAVSRGDFFFSCFWLTHRASTWRGISALTFQVLHYSSVGLNLPQLAVFIWILV
jgi:hypothetical protein